MNVQLLPAPAASLDAAVITAAWLHVRLHCPSLSY